MSQKDARRIGICLNDYEQFWWRADNGEPCPVCNHEDASYDREHRFFVAEGRLGQAEAALREIYDGYEIAVNDEETERIAAIVNAYFDAASIPQGGGWFTKGRGAKCCRVN